MTDEKSGVDNNNDHDHQFDIVMEQIGYQGKFQTCFNYVFNFALIGAASMPYLNIILALAIPEHWCNVPGREQTNYTIEQWINLTIPIEDTKISECKMYNISTQSIDDYSNLEQFHRNSNIIDCQNGWDFDRTWYKETVPSEAQWVCEKGLYVSNIFAFGRIGDVIGTFTFGQLGDKIGRRPVFIITLITLIIGRFVFAFSASSYYLMMFATLLGSLSSTAVFQSPLVIAMEMTEDSRRASIAMMQNIGWSVGVCIMPFIYWALGDWFSFIIVTTIPCIAFLFLSKYMIESPRWLAGQGRTAESVKELEKIAKINGTTVPSDALLTLEIRTEKTEKAYGILSLFSNWRLAKNTTLLVICWINSSLIYYVTFLNVTALKGNPFMNFFWQNISEVPSCILAQISCDKFGRRWSQIFAYVCGAISCVVTIIILNSTNSEIVVTTLASITKFCVSFTFYACTLQTIEIYPTCVRQSGIALGSIASSAFGILGPYIVYLGTTYDARYPPIILIFLSLSAAIFMVFLPETLHQKLPETLEDAQNFGADQKLWSLPKKPKSKDTEVVYKL